MCTCDHYGWQPGNVYFPYFPYFPYVLDKSCPWDEEQEKAERDKAERDKAVRDHRFQDEPGRTPPSYHYHSCVKRHARGYRGERGGGWARGT